MILVTRLDRQVIFLNPDQIVTVEETPDTVITLLNGHHILARERANIIINRIVAFRSKLLRRADSPCRGLKYLGRKNRQSFSNADNMWLQDADRTSICSQDS